MARNNLFDIFEDDIDILEIIDYGFPRLRYTRSAYFHDMDELNFFKRFHLTKPTCLRILALIEDQLEFPTNINDGVSPMNQLLTALRFYASAGHITTVADFCGMHTSTASRIIAKVFDVLAGLRPQFVKMPDTEIAFVSARNEFFRVAHFPRVVGAIDGTLIKIQSPGSEEEEIFRNRKGYFSLNVQVVGNANLEIMDIVARWPGSTHDATNFSNSRIRAGFENQQFPNCFLIGDSGYPLRNYFLTPLLNPRTRAERLYNESHIRTRNSIERLFGIWKRRFPVLSYGMRVKMDTIMNIIVTTGVLHNIAMSMHENEPPPLDDINNEQLEQLIEDGQIPVNIDAGNDRRQLRDQFINNANCKYNKNL